MTKAQLRQLYRQQRQALSEPEWSERCEAITEHFFDFWTHPAAGCWLHTFLPIERQKEVNTWLIVRRLWQDFPSVRVAVPVTDLTAGTMTNYPITAVTPLSLNRYGIPEPLPTPSNKPSVVPYSSIDLVLVPLLAFDQWGNRVGYGGGYYDRFLAQCRPDCLKVGLSLFEPVDEVSDCIQIDVRLNACVTPSQTYMFDSSV